jgi:hypothetical protein
MEHVDVIAAVAETFDGEINIAYDLKNIEI